MKHVIVKGILCITLTTATLQASGQKFELNGTQVVAIGGGGELINNSVSKQTTAMTKTALLESAIGAEYASIKSWESKYNSYLKTASGYAEGLKAATTLYAEGVITLRHLYEIINAVGNNPQGVVATMSMNNLYAETASELIKVYNILRNTLAVGGKANMLTGAERTEILWQVNDNMQDFNRKLRKLALSISYYTLTDVWNKATAGMIERDHGEIAREAYKRWVRAQTGYKNLD
jgi:hypothetical protein